MTSTFQSSTTYQTEPRILGYELQHLHTLGKLLSNYRTDGLIDIDNTLIDDDINRLGDLVLMLSESRMTFDETTDEHHRHEMRHAIELEQMNCVEMMADRYKNRGKKKKRGKK